MGFEHNFIVFSRLDAHKTTQQETQMYEVFV